MVLTEQFAAIQAALQRPIAFHRVFVEIGGGIVPGLFLSQLWYWQGKGSDPEWIHKTIDEWTEETGLSRKEQDRAKRELVDRGLISIEKRGVPCRCYFRLNIAEIIEKIASNSYGYPVCPKRTNKIVPNGQTRLSQTDKQDCPKRTNKIVPNGQTLYKETEITNKDYTETTNRALVVSAEKSRGELEEAEGSELDRWIEALEDRNSAKLDGLKRGGFKLPWRLNRQNSNAASNFDRGLLDRVLVHLRKTPSGSDSMLGDAAMWVARREKTAEGLREINTFWENPQPVAVITPKLAPSPYVAPSPQGIGNPALFYRRLQCSDPTTPVYRGLLGQLATACRSLEQEGRSDLIAPEWKKVLVGYQGGNDAA